MSKIPCTWNGVEYPSIQAAAAAVGITREAMRLRLSKGQGCDADVPARGWLVSYPKTRLERLNDAYVANPAPADVRVEE